MDYEASRSSPTQQEKAARFRALHLRAWRFSNSESVGRPFGTHSGWPWFRGFGHIERRLRRGRWPKRSRPARAAAPTHARSIVEPTDACLRGSWQGLWRPAASRGGNHSAGGRSWTCRMHHRRFSRQPRSSSLRRGPRCRTECASRRGGAGTPVSVHADRACTQLPPPFPKPGRHHSPSSSIRESGS